MLEIFEIFSRATLTGTGLGAALLAVSTHVESKWSQIPYKVFSTILKAEEILSVLGAAVR